MKVPRIIRSGFWPAVYIGAIVFLTWDLHPDSQGGQWFFAGLVSASMFVLLAGERSEPRPPEWRPADYPETVGDLERGDVFFVEPSTRARSAAPVPDHPLIAIGLLGDTDLRAAVSMEDGSHHGLRFEVRVRKVQASVTVLAR